MIRDPGFPDTRQALVSGFDRMKSAQIQGIHTLKDVITQTRQSRGNGRFKNVGKLREGRTPETLDRSLFHRPELWIEPWIRAW